MITTLDLGPMPCIKCKKPFYPFIPHSIMFGLEKRKKNEPVWTFYYCEECIEIAKQEFYNNGDK